MADSGALAEFKQGMQLLRDKKPKSALVHLQKATDMEKQNPYYMSFAGVAMVRAENKWAAAVKLCETALTLKRNEPQLYLNLAEVYVAAGRRGDALTTLERATAAFGRHAGVQKARLKLGARRPPVLTLLNRENVVNRQLGIWRHRALAWSETARVPGAHSFFNVLFCDLS
jgi:Flp pilus assembly protein TadD